MTAQRPIAPRWPDLPAYILGVTKEIWEDRGIATLHESYAPGIVVRSAGGVSIGNGPVIDATLGKMAAFPDIAILAEDVIWCEDETGHALSSHRSVISGTHSGYGAYGPPTGRRYEVRCIADCAVRGEVIDDEWLVYDTGDIARQLGLDPREYARGVTVRPFTPAEDRRGPYEGRGNDSEWGQRLVDILTRIMAKDLTVIRVEYDRAVRTEHAGGRGGWSWDFAETSWMRLRSSFPSAAFAVQHVIGREYPRMPPRAAVRWSLDGKHHGTGAFGAPTGAPMHVMGITHAEFGPWGLRREFTLIDEVAIWKQIHLYTGDI